MISVQDKKNCCGCTACASICPAKCIDMEKDNEGFSYPVVNVMQCRDCGLCDAVCPIGKMPEKNHTEAYVVQDVRDEIRSSSSSGGAFTAIAEYVLQRGGIVYGAAFDQEHAVKHVGVSNTADLARFRGSKYVQSDVQHSYQDVREKLNGGQWVLFSGTPCQVAGLKSYLRKNYEKLLTVDLACHGVPSPKVWEKYLTWWKDKERAALESVEFRSKKYGYSGSTMRLVFGNGTEYSREPMLQLHKNSMFAGLSLRPSCHACSFKTVNRVSDFTLFDCWDVNAFCADMDDDLGTTAVIIQSEKGKSLIDEISKSWRYQAVDLQAIVKNDGDMMTESAPAHPQRKAFFEDLDHMSLTELNRKYFPVTIKKKIIKVLKPILHRLGILNKIKRRLK